MNNLEKIELEIKKEALREAKRKNKRKEKTMQLYTRDSNRKHRIRSAAAIFFFVTVILKYTNDIPIPSEIIFGIPSSAILTVDPKNILTYFKKPPP